MVTETLKELDRDGLIEKLDQMTQELTDFAYIVSHDLKAPLRGIKTIAHWIATDYGEQLGDEGQTQMNLLIGRVDRMQSLIDGVLQYSRLGRHKEDLVCLDMNRLLPDYVDFVGCPDTIQVTIQENLPTLIGEATRVQQIFQNLLSNAVKFMDKPDGRIQVTCQDADEFWQFSVKDNGPGIGSEYYDKIFKIFQTLLSRDEFESTGVGLTLVKKTVERYGGQVWVESEVGLGSTFHFTYPKHIQQESHQAE